MRQPACGNQGFGSRAVRKLRRTAVRAPDASTGLRCHHRLAPRMRSNRLISRRSPRAGMLGVTLDSFSGIGASGRRVNWPRKLASADSECEVVAAVVRFWIETPSWLKCYVPCACHQHPIRDGADILLWTGWLRARFGDGTSMSEIPRIRDFVTFYELATSRIGTLLARQGRRYCP